MDIICITETQLHVNILDSEIQIEGYKIFRKDRSFKLDRSKNDCSSGGGSVIYVKNAISASDVECFSNAPDSVAIKIGTSAGDVCIGCNI